MQEATQRYSAINIEAKRIIIIIKPQADFVIAPTRYRSVNFKILQNFILLKDVAAKLHRM